MPKGRPTPRVRFVKVWLYDAISRQWRVQATTNERAGEALYEDIRRELAKGQAVVCRPVEWTPEGDVIAKRLAEHAHRHDGRSVALMPTGITKRPPLKAGDRVEIDRDAPFGAGLVGRVLMVDETFVGVVGKHWDTGAIDSAVVHRKRCRLVDGGVASEDNSVEDYVNAVTRKAGR